MPATESPPAPKPLLIDIKLSNLDAVKREISELEHRVRGIDIDLDNIKAKLEEMKPPCPAS
jgi:hypothetical protein